VATDPLPAAGYPEWELAALRRRFDILCERADLGNRSPGGDEVPVPLRIISAWV
jgi:hypothetical protein